MLEEHRSNASVKASATSLPYNSNELINLLSGYYYGALIRDSK
jgi:hypothetical protein